MSNFKKQNIKAIDEKYYDYLPRPDVLKREPLPDDNPLTIHMTHMNHLDLAWYWCLDDTVEMALETLRWHVQMIEEYPEVIYTHTQAISLKIVELLDPALFDSIVRLTERGAIVFDSGQVCESDLNMPAEESLARQFLYGQRYLLDRFGASAEVFINSDSFGMFRNLPQLLEKSGLKYMMFKRPREDGDFPKLNPFIWRGLDGTEIPTMQFDNKRHGLPYMYAETLPENYKLGIHHLFSALCNSDSGGVTPYCEPFSLDGYTIQYDTPAGFFEAVLQDCPGLPRFKGLLNYEQRGCYTTHIEEKSNMRRAEMEFRQTELLWSVLAADGYEYPYKVLESNWWRFSFLQFHDIVTGTGCPDAHVESNALYCEIFRSLGELRRKAQLAMDGFVHQTDEIRSFLVLSEREIGQGETVTADINLRVHCEDHLSPLIPDIGWVDMADEHFGMAILDKGNPGHTFIENAMRVSIARSLTLQYGVVSDRGKINTTLKLVPHAGTYRQAEIPKLANNFNYPPIGWQVENFGTNGKSFPSLFIFSEKGISISAVKAAESCEGYVVRLVENHGETHSGILKLGSPFEIPAVFECDILENGVKDLPVSAGDVVLEFSSYEIKTVLIRTDNTPAPADDRSMQTGGIF